MACVFLRKGLNTWTAKIKDHRGRWVQVPTVAATKAEARRLAEDLERKYERQRLGLEPRPGTVKEITFGELIDWWWDRHGCRLRSSTIKAFLEKHLRKPLGDIALGDVTAERFDRLLASKEKSLSPRSINHLRGTVHRMFSLASKPGAGHWSGANPISSVPKRRVSKRLPSFLKYDEVPRVLFAMGGQSQAVVATAIYTGLRRGEIFALRKSDIDWEDRTIQVCKSWEADSTKDGKVALIPIADGLLPFLKAAAKASPTKYLFPRPDGTMQDRDVNIDRALRNALGRAGVVDGYEHRCRKTGCGFKELRPNSDQGKCPQCKRSLWPVAVPRKIRFHDLRHTAATLLLKEGVSLPVVQRILRHSDPRLTTETYGHLEVDDMRAAIAHLSFGVKPQAKPFGALVVQELENQKEEGRDALEISSNVAALEWSGRQDLNLRPLGPEPSALPG
jgi:integrase